MYIELVHGVSNKQNLGGRPRGSRKGGVLVFLRHRHGVLLPSQETAGFHISSVAKGGPQCYKMLPSGKLLHFTSFYYGKSKNYSEG